MFKYCPQCRALSPEFLDNKQIHCSSCGFTYFHNAAAAVMCILVYGSKILVAIRNKEPAKGLLDMIGGFLDHGESAEQALIREVKEELGIEISQFTYLGSSTNEYLYKNVLYQTCDLIYLSELTTIPTNFDSEEIQQLLLLYPDEIKEKDIGFKSMTEALKLYRQWKGKNIIKIIQK
jgi:NADH pyrophosphatase NudC (nudix superfamily)